MSKQEIKGSVVFTHLSKMIQEDILVLNTMSKRISKNDKVYELVTSLIRAKERILPLLPSYKKLTVSGDRPELKKPSNIVVKRINSNDRDIRHFPDILLEMEKSQMNLVENFLNLEEISPRRKEILSNIYDIYSRITKHLKACVTSGRLTPIEV